jgi:hypothetical protein
MNVLGLISQLINIETLRLTNVIFYILFEESYKFLLHAKSPILFLLHSFHLLVSYRVYEPIWLYIDTNVHREL